MKLAIGQSVILATSLIGLPVLADSLPLKSDSGQVFTPDSYFVVASSPDVCSQQNSLASPAGPCSGFPAINVEHPGNSDLTLIWQESGPSSTLVASLDSAYAGSPIDSYPAAVAVAAGGLDAGAGENMLELTAAAEVVVDVSANAALQGRGYQQSLRSLLPAFLLLAVIGLATVSVGFAMRRAFVDPAADANQIPLW